MPDLPQIIEAFGGGAGAIVILALVGGLGILWRSYTTSVSARIADQKEHTDQIVETIRTVDKAIAFVERRHG